MLRTSLYRFDIVTCSSILLNSDLTSCTCLSNCEADTCSDITEGPLIYVDEELKHLQILCFFWLLLVGQIKK